VSARFLSTIYGTSLRYLVQKREADRRTLNAVRRDNTQTDGYHGDRFSPAQCRGKGMGRDVTDVAQKC
jgi:hypothetical protein